MYIEIDTSEVEQDWNAGVTELERDVDDATRLAADAGIVHAQQNHPYQDRSGTLTGTAHVARVPEGSEMVWPAKYAGFVNDGTSRARAFPFVPEAIARARKALETYVTLAVEKLKKRF